MPLGKKLGKVDMIKKSDTEIFTILALKNSIKFLSW
jgi:hypothetical protein